MPPAAPVRDHWLKRRQEAFKSGVAPRVLGPSAARRPLSRPPATWFPRPPFPLSCPPRVPNGGQAVFRLHK
eukprot:7316229-Pyramimonas_sp.AAC.1